jgi:hypothetical protein
MNIQGLMRLVTVPKWRQRLGDITTPKIIVDSLISYLEEDPVLLLKQGEILLDPCCGHASILLEIANRAKQTMDPITIAKQLWGYDINHADTARKLLANELGIDQEYINIYQEDSLKADMKIKNFRVVMNPPFNEEPGEQRDDAGNSNNSILYQAFVDKFAKNKNCKQVVSLNPAGWTIKPKEVAKYKEMSLKAVEFLPSSHFPSVTIRSGLTISNFVNKYDGDITITTTENSSYTQKREEDIKNISLEAKSILNKISEYENLGSVVTTGSINLPKGTKASTERAVTLDPKKFNSEESAQYPNKLLAFVGNGVNLKWLWTNDKCVYSPNHKVVVSTATSKYFLGNVITLGPNVGISRSNMLILVKNEKQAKIYKEYLDSKFVKFIIKQVKFNDVVNTKTNSWNYIPVPPIDEWEEDQKIDIYGYFNLTTEEIKHIEADQ